MKEITRIHIAKTPYDIEIAAKKALETYMKSLEMYSADKEILEDIEIRITEILAERGVKKGGVISEDDVAALKNQLGEPREFMTDGDAAVEPNETETSEVSRKLYRDLDNRVFGGVLAGIAAFFKINPLWVRLVFIIIALASFGTALLVYVVLWIAVPPARTAADKLQMAGRPVTVNSIRELNENEISRPASNADTRRVVLALLGVGCIIGATVAAIITIVAGLAMILSGRYELFNVVVNSSPLFAAYILAIASGLLLVVMFILMAYASFAQKMTRRVVVSLCVVVALGLASFVTAIGLVQYGSFELHQEIQANTRETALQLPATMKSVKSLNVDAAHVDVKYIVSKDTPTATVQAVAKNDAAMPKVNVSLQNGMLKITAKQTQNDGCIIAWGCGNTPTVTVYGPALSQITANEKSSVEYQATDQQKLIAIAQQDAGITVSSGTIDTLNATVGSEATMSAADATVRHLEADVKTSATVEAGTVQTFALVDQDFCPSRTSETNISIWRVTSGMMTINGKMQPAKAIDTGCVEIDMEGENND